MLRIVIEGVEVDYPENISITVKKQNPFFAEQSFNEGSSYAFTLDRTPQIQKLLYNKNSQKKKVNAQVYFSAFCVANGKLVFNTTQNDKISFNIIEEGTDLRKRLIDTHFDKLSLKEIEVCEETDSVATKLQKWNDHMTQTTILDDHESGTHKFPKMQSHGYKFTQSTSEILNKIFSDNNSFINAYCFNEYIKNEGVPAGFDFGEGDQKAWFSTVSPCPRIQYILEETLSFMGVNRINNRLESIPEFKQMYHFSGYVLDKLEEDGGELFNVHGTTINLSDHLPDNNMFSIFQLLSEVFQAYYIQSGNSLDILIRDDVLKMKPIDMSKWCSEKYSTKTYDGEIMKLKYPIEEEDLPFYDNTYYSEITSYLDAPIENYADVTTSKSDSLSVTEISLEHIPLNCYFFNFLGVYKTFTDWQSQAYENTYGWEEFSTISTYLKEIRSDEYPEEGIEVSKTFNWGFLRGMYTTRRDVFDPFPIGTIPNKIGEVAQPHMYNYGFREIMIHDDTLAAFAPYQVVLGETSAYISGEDDVFNKYHKSYYDFLSNYRDIQKNLTLPIHEAMKLMNWKQPKHVIHQRNLSFQGIVKDATFTLTKNSISPTTITYAVENNTTLNDFNDDFNDDFLN